MTTDVIFADVSGRVSILFHGFGDRNCLRCHVFVLFWPQKLRLLFTDAAFAIAVETSHDIDVIMDPCRVLARQHRCSRGSAIGLSIRMSKTQALAGQLCQMWCDVLFLMSPHRYFVDADVVPAKVIHHVDDNIGLLCLDRSGRDQHQS